MPEGFFMYYEASSTGYDPVSDARTVGDYLQRTLNAGITEEQRNTLSGYLQSIGLVLKYDGQGNVLGFKIADDKKKKDIITVVSKRSNPEGLLKAQQELLKADNVRQTAVLLEVVTHLGERIQILKDRLNNLEYQKEFDKHRQHFQIRPILRNPGHDLFIGDFTNCCLGMNSSQYPDAMMERLIDEGLNVIEVIDESTQKTMAAAWVYIAQDGSFVIQNLEINAEYERTKPLMDKVGESMIDYARQFARYIGAKRLLIGNPGHGKYFGSGGFIDIRYGNKKVAYGLDKIGGYLGEKYYLDSAGKPTAYLVGDRAMNAKINNKLGDDLGGIDFNTDKMNLQIQYSGGEIKFHLDPAMLQQLQNATGFVPVIINIQPMTNLRQFLGLDATNPTPV
jgi:predicted house-cleaning noncanonical NTP pyrophosphatase (MazG superfamily)